MGLRKHCEYKMRTQEQSKKYIGNKETFNIGERGNMAEFCKGERQLVQIFEFLTPPPGRCASIGD